MDISIADIRKQPSPVIDATIRSGLTRWAPIDAGIAQPMLWLFAGVKNRRGPGTSIASAAQWTEAVTSTKISSSGPSAHRSWSRKAIGSTPVGHLDLAVLAAVDLSENAQFV